MPGILELNEGAPFTPDEFREMFPVFTDPTVFADSRVIFFTNLAMMNLAHNKWGTTWSYGCSLFVAHNLALEQNMLGTQPGGEGTSGNYGYGGGGITSGSSKSIGQVSKSESFDTTFYKSAGDYAETKWGRILWRYIRMFGAGGMTAWNSMQLR